MQVNEVVYQFLREHHIEHRSVSHDPVHTIEDCSWAGQQLSAHVCKNLLLTPRNESAFYLCVVHASASFRTALVSKQIGSSRLSFASAQRMAELLRTQPGALSPMGLIFDPEHRVQLLVDRRLQAMPQLAFHPCLNTQTLAMPAQVFFEDFLPACGHAPRWVDLQEQTEV